MNNGTNGTRGVYIGSQQNQRVTTQQPAKYTTLESLAGLSPSHKEAIQKAQEASSKNAKIAKKIQELNEEGWKTQTTEILMPETEPVEVELPEPGTEIITTPLMRFEDDEEETVTPEIETGWAPPLRAEEENENTTETEHPSSSSTNSPILGPTLRLDYDSIENLIKEIKESMEILSNSWNDIEKVQLETINQSWAAEGAKDYINAVQEKGKVIEKINKVLNILIETYQKIVNEGKESQTSVADILSRIL